MDIFFFALLKSGKIGHLFSGTKYGILSADSVATHMTPSIGSWMPLGLCDSYQLCNIEVKRGVRVTPFSFLWLLNSRAPAPLYIGRCLVNFDFFSQNTFSRNTCGCKMMGERTDVQKHPGIWCPDA